MQDPQPALQTALYAALTTPALLLDEVTVPVYAYVPSQRKPPYVLLTLPTTVTVPGPAACQVWECTFLLKIVTHFPATNQASSKPVWTISEQVLTRLEGQRLALPDGLQMNPIEVAFANTLSEADGDALVVLRDIRLKVTAYR